MRVNGIIEKEIVPRDNSLKIIRLRKNVVRHRLLSLLWMYFKAKAKQMIMGLL